MNTINNLQAIGDVTFSQDFSKKADNNKGNAFDSFFEAAMEVINDTNATQIESEQLYMDFATGKTDNILDVILSQRKASSSLTFTVQITNKIIDAYKEIMRMQV